MTVSPAPDELIEVEVVLATPEKQSLLKVSLPAGSTLSEAIDKSGVLQGFDAFEVDPSRVGIFGRKASMDQVLNAGDRVEIYRALIADPKQVRRERAIRQAES